MFRRMADFTTVWSAERSATLQILRSLDDSSLSTATAEGHRSLGRLAWHLTTTIAEMMERTGLSIAGPAPDTPVPASAAEIASAYETASQSLAHQLTGWTDANLDTEDDMYGQRWARGRTLLALVVHQAHHRGQMTVLMRQAGRPVPGVYGPSRDEWARMGMQPPAV